MTDKENDRGTEIEKQTNGEEDHNMSSRSVPVPSDPKDDANQDGPHFEAVPTGKENTTIQAEIVEVKDVPSPDPMTDTPVGEQNVDLEKGDGKEIPREGEAPPPDDHPDPLKDLEMFSRRQMVEKLTLKHSDLKLKYTKEMDELDIKPPEIIDLKEGERSIRDVINEDVQALKTKRGDLRRTNKELRSEFFALLEKEERLKDHRKEVEMYSNFSRDLEWKLETEAITIETERRLLDELRGTLDKMRAITEGYTPDEIKARLTEIQEEIGSNLMMIEELHNALLEKVEESNLHHERYMGANKQIRERESRRGWLKRRIELHAEMETFWKTQMDQADKLDAEESTRTLEDIRNLLIETFQKRENEDREEHAEADKVERPQVRKGRRREHRDRPSRTNDAKGPSTPSDDAKEEPMPSHDEDKTVGEVNGSSRSIEGGEA
ncbi:MAG: hypothetical protein JXA22_01095 [Candidatus Thermoplasmatota archaeon]|nr:hypothetical protein [Candidatus Thermoplasmatota archaeon]